MVTLYDYDTMQARIAELEAENGKLRKALEAVEWVGDEFGEHCPWCYAKGIYLEMEYIHKPDCQRQLALGLTEVEK